MSSKNQEITFYQAEKGGYYMITYPGAKGQDRYTITKVDEGRYHVDAQYYLLMVDLPCSQISISMA